MNCFVYGLWIAQIGGTMIEFKSTRQVQLHMCIKLKLIMVYIGVALLSLFPHLRHWGECCGWILFTNPHY